MRKKIQSKQTAEKVSLDHLRAFQVKARTYEQIKDKLKEYERIRHQEIIHMFKIMSYKTELDERRDCRHLSKVFTKDTIINVNRTVVVPTSYEMMNDTVLGIYRVGKDFVKRKIKKAEVVPVIDWNTLRTI
jgi:hypothetical protein